MSGSESVSELRKKFTSPSSSWFTVTFQAPVPDSLLSLSQSLMLKRNFGIKITPQSLISVFRTGL